MIFPFFFSLSFFLVLGSLISVSSVTWFGVWAGMEVNLLCFIPMVVHFSNFMGIESVVKYFLIQAFGSVGVLFGGLFEDSYMWGFLGLFFVLCFSLFLKIGVFPFHWWLPGVLSGFSWFGVMVLSTWQKVAPVLVFSSLSGSSLWMMLLAAFSSLVGGLGGVGQTSVRSVLAYSSISHAGWFISVFCVSWVFGFFYFFVYLVMTFWFIFLFWLFDYSFFSQFFFSSVVGCFLFFVSVLTMAGVPPFFGFFIKVFAFMAFSSSFLSVFLLFFLIVGSLISLYFYLGLFFSGFLFFFSFFSFTFYGVSFFFIYIFFFLSCFGFFFFDLFFLFFYDILV